MNDYKKLWWLISIAAIIKIIAANFLELGNDEVYYYTYALQPDFNHFDHPPMVGFFIRLFTLNLTWVNDVSVRLGAIVSCAISTIFIFKIGSVLKNTSLGWYAALVYNCAVYTSFIGGFFILPDSPQMPFYTASLYIMSVLIFANETKKIKLWLLLGLSIGLACLCKVHGLYLWAGFGLFILLTQIKLLLNWRLYASFLVTTICILPILYWNITNHFITYTFHAERVAHTSILWNSLLQEIMGEFLYQNPIIFILILLSITSIIRKKVSIQSTQLIWILSMSLPMIAIFWSVSLFNYTLPHWSGPAYIPLYFLAAYFLHFYSKKVYPLVIKMALVLMLVVLFVFVALVQFAPFNLGSKNEENYGEFCPTLDVSGWHQFAKEFKSLTKSDIDLKIMKPNSAIITPQWFPGGHIDFYVSRQTNNTLLAVGSLQDIHKFAWLNKDRKWLQLNDDAYCIVPSNIIFDVQNAYGKYFTTIEKPVIINQIRGGKMVRYFKVYRLKNVIEVPKKIVP